MADPLGRKAAIGMIAALAMSTVAVAPASTAPSASRSSTCQSDGEPVRVASVGSRLDLRLDDGRLARLAGFDPVTPTPTAADLEEKAAATLATLVVGRTATMTRRASRPDRWGREVIALCLSPSGTDTSGHPGAKDLTATDLAAAAIAVGLGRYLSEPAAHVDRAALLSAEDGARRDRLGLWADPYYAVLAVDDRSAFAERTGTIVVAEGRLTAVVPGPFRTRLRFARPDASNKGRAPFAHDPVTQTLSATILPHTMKTFEAQSVTPSSLIGRTLRWRGLLDTRFGPGIELAGPDDVEVLPDAPEAVASTRPN